MSARLFLLIGLWLALAVPAHAQGFAGMGAQAEGFAIPQRGQALSFPADHGAHPEYRIEWWYLTANLRGADGRDYGVQWTLFRSALAPETRPGWEDPQIWMGHAGLTTPERHFVAERLARGGVGQAGVRIRPFEAFIDDWAMTSRATPGQDALASLTLTARGADFSYTLALEAGGPLVAQGDGGFSVKSPEGQASYYYSQPFYRVSGMLDLPGGPVAVAGNAWLDREWSSQPLSADQTGWDWVSLHFEGGEKMMGFHLRSRDGGTFGSGTWIAPDGTPAPFGDGAFTMIPLETAQVAGRAVPVRWRLRHPGRGLDIEIAALNPQAWMETLFPYWEGPVRITGSHTGMGYLEMTGYE